MNRKLRKTIIAGNWKMNKNRAETSELLGQIAPLAAGANCEVIVCTPFTSLDAALTATGGTEILVGAQNCHWEKSGAYTGEVAAEMLVDMGVKVVIIGHSERRQYFGETDATVQKRVRAALDAGMTVILCVGETLEQRERDITKEVCGMQVKVALGGVSGEELSRIIIAYEPVWAIGTGKTATAAQAGEACGDIRGVVAQLYGKAASEALTIQYGGSMNAANAAELLAQEHVDGGLIGGASLKAADFGAIIAAANQ